MGFFLIIAGPRSSAQAVLRDSASWQRQRPEPARIDVLPAVPPEDRLEDHALRYCGTPAHGTGRSSLATTHGLRVGQGGMAALRTRPSSTDEFRRLGRSTRRYAIEPPTGDPP